MKITAKMIIAFAVIICAAAAVFAGYNHVKNIKVILPENFTLTAHTGREGTADNSICEIKQI